MGLSSNMHRAQWPRFIHGSSTRRHSPRSSLWGFPVKPCSCQNRSLRAATMDFTRYFRCGLFISLRGRCGQLYDGTSSYSTSYPRIHHQSMYYYMRRAIYKRSSGGSNCQWPFTPDISQLFFPSADVRGRYAFVPGKRPGALLVTVGDVVGTPVGNGCPYSG